VCRRDDAAAIRNALLGFLVVSVVIVNYEGRRLLERCLTSVRAKPILDNLNGLINAPNNWASARQSVLTRKLPSGISISDSCK